jgi:predicted Zn-dependent protease
VSWTYFPPWPGAASAMWRCARRRPEAIEHYRAVLDRVPQATAIHYSLAIAYRENGPAGRARAHLERRGQAGVHAADPRRRSPTPSCVASARGDAGQARACEAAASAAVDDAFTKALAAVPSSVTAQSISDRRSCDRFATPMPSDI